MEYNEEQYLSDLDNPDMPHLSSRERFEAFYNYLGEGPARLVGYPKHRMDWITIKHPAFILELGCHNGYNLVHWGQQHNETKCVGIDISAPLLQIAWQRIAQAGLEDRVAAYWSFIEDYDSEAEFTDIVLTETLEHVQDPQEVLDAAVNLMSPGAKLWITVPSRRWGNFSHVRGIRSEKLSDMLHESGAGNYELILADEKMMQGELLTRCLVRRQS